MCFNTISLILEYRIEKGIYKPILDKFNETLLVSAILHTNGHPTTVSPLNLISI